MWVKMKFKGYILFAMIALMLLINVGNVFAKDGVNIIGYKVLPIDGLNNSDTQILVNIRNTELRTYTSEKPLYLIGVLSNYDATYKNDLARGIQSMFMCRDISNQAYGMYAIGNQYNGTVEALANTFVMVNKIPPTGSINSNDDVFSATTYLALPKDYKKYSSLNIYVVDHSTGRDCFWIARWVREMFINNLDGTTSLQIPVTKLTSEKPKINTSSSANATCVGGASNGVLDKGEQCDTDTFYMCNDPECNSSSDVKNATCSELNKELPILGYVSGNLGCDSDCTINTTNCTTTSNTNQTDPNSSSSTPQTPSKIKLDLVNESGDGYICDNHVCYYTETYMDSTEYIQLIVSGRTGDTCYFSNASNENWKNDSSKLSNCTEMKSEFETGQNIHYKINIEENVPINVNLYSNSFPSGYLLVGTPSNYDYYFFVYVNDLTSSAIDLYKINNRKLIDFYGGSLPEWIPNVSGGVLDSTTPDDCELFDSKLCSFRMVNLSDDINQDGIIGPGQIIKDSDKNLEMTIKITYDSLNISEDDEVIVEMNKVVEDIGMTEEEHAVWFSIIGSESNFNKTVTVGTDGVSYGIGQVNINAWGNSSTDYLTTHPKVVEVIVSSGVTITTNQDYINFVNSTKTDWKKGLVLSAAVFLESRDKLQTQFSEFGITDIDQPNESINDAINTAFGSFYQYMIGSDVGAQNFTKGIPDVGDYYVHKVNDGTGELDNWAVYASMRKTSYYLYFYNNFMEVFHPGYVE